MIGKINWKKNSILIAALAIVLITTYVIAAPPGSKYTPGETLDPTCAPGDINCSVDINANDAWLFNGNDIYNSNSGNVGIGTNIPNAKLDVNGKISQIGLGGSTFIGYQAGMNDDLSNNNNTAIGYQAFYSNTTGSLNTVLGNYALFQNASGTSNTAIGYSALNNNINGNNNTAIGSNSLYSNTIGMYNVAIGNHAGHYTDFNGSNTNSMYSIYIGYNTKTLSLNSTNEIVIGANTTGFGSNSVVLGNDSIVTTILRGNVGIGITTPNQKLDVEGLIGLQNTDTPGICNTTNEGAIYYDASLNEPCFCNATSWQQFDGGGAC